MREKNIFDIIPRYTLTKNNILNIYIPNTINKSHFFLPSFKLTCCLITPFAYDTHENKNIYVIIPHICSIKNNITNNTNRKRELSDSSIGVPNKCCANGTNIVERSNINRNYRI